MTFNLFTWQRRLEETESFLLYILTDLSLRYTMVKEI